MAKMERDEAVSRATDYLSRKGGDNWANGDELKRRTNENTGFMATAQAIADIYQRGERPRDLDLQKIDFGVSYSNVRTQIEELLDKRGAKDFDKKVDAEIESQMERAKEMLKKEEEKREEIRKKAQEEAEELIDNKGKLYQARESAWTGYQLSSLESRNWANPIIEMIEYARAILEIDEKLEDNFEGEYTVLKKRAEQMRELANQIEGLNFEASEIDQANIPEDEQRTQETEDLSEGEKKDLIYEEIKEFTQTETGQEMDSLDIQMLIDTVKEEYDLSEEEIENQLEKLKVEGTAYEPAPGKIQILDHQVKFYNQQASLSEHIDDQGRVKMGDPFGNLSIQVVKSDDSEIDTIKTSRDVMPYLKEKIGDQTSEHLLAIYLTGSNEVLGSQTIGKGSISNVQLEPRSIVQMGIIVNAKAVILAHNHPSGKAEATKEDKRATRELEQQLSEFNISLLDHIIVTGNDTHSLRTEGIL